MKAAVLSAIRKFEKQQVPEPRVARDTDVLIRIKTVGVCGSDIHYYTAGRIGDQIVKFPFIVGHEASGVVEETGKGVSRVKKGQRIAVDPSVCCGECDQCRSGREHTCRNVLFLGCPGQLEGCLCEFVVLPEQNCFPIPDSMTFEQATLVEPLAIGVYTVERSAPSAIANANAAILGVGPIGMSVFHVLRTMKTGRIYVTDRIENRLAMARQLDPVWSGDPDRVDVVAQILHHEPLALDIVYECSGDTKAVAQAVRLLKPGGKLVQVGIPEPDTISLPIHELRRKEITIINIRRQLRCTQKAIELVATRAVVLDPMITHRFSLDQTGTAFDIVAGYKDGIMKAMIAVA
jgi:L-iditol 2-dehydrogenase